MFKVKKKGTDEISTVYDVSGTRFLVYVEGQEPHWEWHDMNDYEPDTLELFNQPVTLRAAPVDEEVYP